MASSSSVMGLLKKISYYLISQHNCLKENNIKISRSMDQAISDLVSELNVITVETETYLSDETPKPAKFTPSLKYGPKSKRRKFFEEVHDYTNSENRLSNAEQEELAVHLHVMDTSAEGLMQLHDQKESDFCLFCGRSVEATIEHFNAIHSNSANVPFPSGGYLLSCHRYCYENQNQNKKQCHYHCPRCLKSFRSSSSIKRHIERDICEETQMKSIEKEQSMLSTSDFASEEIIIEEMPVFDGDTSINMIYNPSDDILQNTLQTLPVSSALPCGPLMTEDQKLELGKLLHLEDISLDRLSKLHKNAEKCIFCLALPFTPKHFVKIHQKTCVKTPTTGFLLRCNRNCGYPTGKGHYHCPDCKKSYGKRSSLERHFKRATCFGGPYKNAADDDSDDEAEDSQFNTTTADSIEDEPTTTPVPRSQLLSRTETAFTAKMKKALSDPSKETTDISPEELRQQIDKYKENYSPFSLLEGGVISFDDKLKLATILHVPDCQPQALMELQNEFGKDNLCLFCGVSHTTENSMTEHMWVMHTRNNVRTPADGYILGCKLKCNALHRYQKYWHYHCPRCKNTFLKLSSVKRHFTRRCYVEDKAVHVRKEEAAKIALQEHSEDLLDTEDNSDLLQNEVEEATLTISESNNTTEEIPKDLLDLIEDKSKYEEYKCNGCSKKFKTQALLRAHSKKHSNERPYQCQYCPNNYKSKETLDSHVRSHTGETPYECKFCDRKFAWRTSAYRHMKDEHGTDKVKKYKCPAEECDDAYYTTLELKKHITVHVGSDGFACHFCLQLFDKYKQLQQHLLVHITKPVTCDICGLGVCSNTSLRRHMMTHTGEKPHKCPVCDVGFPVRSSLKHHMLTHTGEKPHKCEFCPAQFAQSGNLTIHAKRCARRQQAKVEGDYPEQDDDDEEEEIEEEEDQIEEDEMQSDTMVYYQEEEV